MYIVMLGGPGSGKGTTSETLAQEFDIEHISTGDMLREEVHNKSKIGMQVEHLLADGKLVPDEIVTQLIKNRLRNSDNGAVFDGYPRTLEQAKILTKILKELKVKLDIAIELDVPDEIIIQRIINRELCSNKKCGAIYNKKFKPSKREGICDRCGSKLLTRVDDNRETVQKRLDIYHKESEEIIKYYKENKLLHTIHPNEDTKPEEVLDEIVRSLKW